VIQERLNYPASGRILLRDGEKMWLASPNQVGFYLDPQATALSAYELGRSGNPVAQLLARFESWYLGTSLPPLYVFDERAAQLFLAGIAAQIDIPTVDASLTVQDTNVVVRPGQIGRTVDLPATIEALRAQLQNLRDGEVQLATTESPPAILNVDEQAEIARRILSQPLTLTLPGSEEDDPGPWTFDPEALSNMLTIQRVSATEGDNYQVGLQADGLRSFLEGIAPELIHTENARFIFNDDSRQLGDRTSSRRARPGR
jgi:hypothetical protein